ncbi:ROK family protein [Lactiplantibacillus songbeiensis]|uniref:ROK family protein n=1 Tax=Lactiplantibacillus songbeiensis TaxID=2559920 RepID=A0ABW4C0F2_9LACO|nr:ROK family protein [Lactiplantibacillus songbeiensis]
MAIKNYLAIDIGGTFLKYALIRADGQIIIKGSNPTAKSGQEPFVAQIVDLIQRHQDQISGVGFSLPGVVDAQAGKVISSATLPFLEGSNFINLIQAFFPSLLITIENDGDAAALAERWLGNLAGIDNGAILVLGSGVGAAIFINGQLFQGSHFVAGEPSFMIIDRTKGITPASTAASLSAVGMVHQIGKKLGLIDPTNGYDVFRAISERQEVAIKIFQQFCQEVAVLIFNMQSTLDLERIIIGGGISAQPLVAKQIQHEFDQLKQVTPLSARTIVTPEIMNAHLQNGANLIGAVYRLSQMSQ